jgi:hypothetical protein
MMGKGGASCFAGVIFFTGEAEGRVGIDSSS